MFPKIRTHLFNQQHVVHVLLLLLTPITHIGDNGEAKIRSWGLSWQSLMNNSFYICVDDGVSAWLYYVRRHETEDVSGCHCQNRSVESAEHRSSRLENVREINIKVVSHVHAKHRNKWTSCNSDSLLLRLAQQCIALTSLDNIFILIIGSTMQWCVFNPVFSQWFDLFSVWYKQN